MKAPRCLCVICSFQQTDENPFVCCALLQDFQLMMPQLVCLPTIHFQPPSLILLSHVERVEMGREQGEQQENSGWDSAVRSVVARAERIGCCIGQQQQYCVSGLSLCLSFEYHPFIQTITVRNLILMHAEALIKYVGIVGRFIAEDLFV